MTTRAAQGLGWAMFGLVMAFLAWLVLLSGFARSGSGLDAAAHLFLIGGLTFLVSGLLVTAFALIRKS